MFPVDLTQANTTTLYYEIFELYIGPPRLCSDGSRTAGGRNHGGSFSVPRRYSYKVISLTQYQLGAQSFKSWLEHTTLLQRCWKPEERNYAGATWDISPCFILKLAHHWPELHPGKYQLELGAFLIQVWTCCFSRTGVLKRPSPHR
ncbi:hypothetical protein B0H19DRAFT_1071676 [Mycena capillaripes]|nr:hypothetical protein B0H19DRAFT_1071676 [Mycena capillaripes]